MVRNGVSYRAKQLIEQFETDWQEQVQNYMDDPNEDACRVCLYGGFTPSVHIWVPKRQEEQFE